MKRFQKTFTCLKPLTARTMIAAFCLLLGPASRQSLLAHTCPTDASDTGVGVTLAAFRINPDGSTGPAIGGGSVGICECLRLRMAISYVPIGPSGGKVAFFQGGTMTVSTTSASFTDDVTPAGGVPLVGNPADPNAAACPGATLSFLSDFSADYCVKASDINVAGDIVFMARYVGGFLHIATDIANQPTGTTAISVHVDQGPSCSIQPATQTICGGASATFTASGSGAAPPFTFTWTGPSGFTASGAAITLNNVAQAAAGTYTATVKDAHGCTSTCTASLVVTPCNPKICVTKQITCLPANAICDGSLAYSDTATGVAGAANPSFCYKIVVSNCGQEDLKNVTLHDPDLPGLSVPGTLTIGQAVTLFAQKSWGGAGSPHVNTVTVNGVGASSGTSVSDHASATAVVLAPGLACVKRVTSADDQDGSANDSNVTLLADGSPHTVSYSVEVSNTGSLGLMVKIGDPTLAGIPGCSLPGPFALAAGESKTVPLCDVVFNFGAAGANDCANPLLGQAGRCTVLQLGGGHKVDITGPPGGIVGDVCIGPNTHLSITGGEFVTGDIRLAPGAVLSKSGSGVIGGDVLKNVDLSAEINDAIATSTSAAALPCTRTFPTINKTMTITGAAGVNVICVTDVVLNGSVVTVTGPPGATFIFNVTGKFVLNGTSKFVVGGGVQPRDVLYNIIGPGPQVAFTGGGGGTGCCKSSVDGSLIALHRNIALSPGLVNGQLIGGLDISIVSGSSVRCPPTECLPPTVNVVTVTGVADVSVIPNGACRLDSNGNPIDITVSSQCEAMVQCR